MINLRRQQFISRRQRNADSKKIINYRIYQPARIHHTRDHLDAVSIWLWCNFKYYSNLYIVGFVLYSSVQTSLWIFSDCHIQKLLDLIITYDALEIWNQYHQKSLTEKISWVRCFWFLRAINSSLFICFPVSYIANAFIWGATGQLLTFVLRRQFDPSPSPSGRIGADR